MRFVIIVCFLLLSVTGIGQLDCMDRIKNGYFFSTYEDEVTVIQRDGSHQRELLNEGNSAIYSDIRWINKRKFELTLTKVENMDEVLLFVPIGSVVIGKVLSCDEDSYVYRMTFKNQDFGEHRMYFFDPEEDLDQEE